jgi:hypothetical protein
VHAAKKYYVRLEALVLNTRLRMQRGVGVAGSGLCLLNGHTTKGDSIASVEGVGDGVIYKIHKDKDFEACAVMLNLSSNRLCIITINRAPTGNTYTFITKLDTIHRNLHTSKQEFIICGDININYLPDSERKSRLDALLRTYNLIGTVNFPTRIQGNSATAIHNIFIDITRLDNYLIRPLINRLSDHDEQSIPLNTVNMSVHVKQFKLIRKISKHTTNNFLISLSYETWDYTFSGDDVNIMLNSFLDTYLKIYYFSFPQKN